MITKPLNQEYPDYYHTYIDELPDQGILEYLKNQSIELIELYKNISEDRLNYKYAEGKWTIKEILAHLLDSEIILGYRALRYARNDTTDLSMYDHDNYVKTGMFNLVSSDLLIKHYASVRESNYLLFKTFTDEVWLRKGLTGGKQFTTRTIPYITAGHTQHHIKVIEEKYLCY